MDIPKVDRSINTYLSKYYPYIFGITLTKKEEQRGRHKPALFIKRGESSNPGHWLHLHACLPLSHGGVLKSSPSDKVLRLGVCNA
jgi:hypothetical protein